MQFVVAMIVPLVGAVAVFWVGLNLGAKHHSSAPAAPQVSPKSDPERRTRGSDERNTV
jgi:hypothetical protein